MINLDFNIGDSVGEIYKRSDDKWVLLENGTPRYLPRETCAV